MGNHPVEARSATPAEELGGPVGGPLDGVIDAVAKRVEVAAGKLAADVQTKVETRIGLAVAECRDAVYLVGAQNGFAWGLVAGLVIAAIFRRVFP